MAEEKTPEKPTLPEPSITAHTIKLDGTETPYKAEAGWLALHKGEEPSAEMFHVFYETESPEPSTRPITFVFNGGPGAASAYLHMGALGPKRVVFEESGNPLPPPVTVIDNDETWLAFTDLVFVDPIGTGFSRAIVGEPDKDEKKVEPDEQLKKKSQEYWKIKKDLESLCEFITAFLSKHHRWDSPVFVAGESYGGFRGAKLARQLQESYGVGLNGVILISPALEFSLLDNSDYDVLGWIDRIPTMAGAAHIHGLARGPNASADQADYMDAAAEFAGTQLAVSLVRGAADEKRTQVLKTLADTVGLPEQLVDEVGGRITAWRFVRELLKDKGLVCGLYDASITAVDPFPGREHYEGPDPTLRSIERVFAAGVNAHLRHTLNVDTERRYHLLSFEVNRNWQVDIERHAFEGQIGATDDLRYALTLNANMKVRITHGKYDLITPYHSSDRLADQMFLKDPIKENLSLVHYPGGHMFYAWEKSRRQFTADMKEFYSGAVSSSR